MVHFYKLLRELGRSFSNFLHRYSANFDIHQVNIRVELFSLKALARSSSDFRIDIIVLPYFKDASMVTMISSIFLHQLQLERISGSRWSSPNALAHFSLMDSFVD